MSTTELITLVATILTAGWVSAFLVQLIKQISWPSWTKLVLSGVVAAAVALAASWISGDLLHVITVFNAGDLTSQEAIIYFSGVFGAAATWYRVYFQNAEWAKNLALWPNAK